MRAARLGAGGHPLRGERRWWGRLAQVWTGLWAAAYRPFFAMTGLVAVAAGVGWCLALTGLVGTVPGVASWHARALSTGFIGAALGGYLLSALPGWSGRAPVTGATLAALVAAWALGLIGGDAGRVGIGLLYPLALAALLARDLLAARAYGRLWVLAFPFGLAVQSAGLGQGVGGWFGPETAALALMLGISAIGGRMIGAFGAAHLSRRSDHRARQAEARSNRAARVATAVLALALVAGALDGGTLGGGGWALVLAGGVQLWVPVFWLTRRVRDGALFVQLPLAYLWLPVGVCLVGALRLGMPLGALTQTDALHALTMGAAACMIAAVAGRAAARRGDGALQGRPVQASAFGAIWLAAVARLLAGLGGPLVEGWLLASVILWILGWGLWLVALLPALVGPPRRPALSARRLGAV